jgi:hypothetical protein
MTSDLRDALERRAAALEVPDFDVADLLARGERRVRRRRIGSAVGAGILAFAVVAGTVLLVDRDAPRRADPVRPSPTDARTTRPDAAATRPLVWAVEAGLDRHRAPARIHVGDRRVQVEARVGSLQATDDGVAYLTDAPGPFTTVWFTDGRTVTRLGRTGDAGVRGDEIVKSAVAGSRVAWIEYPPSPPAQVVLYDTHLMTEVARTPVGGIPGCGHAWPRRGRQNCLSVLAVRDGTVFVGPWAGNFDGVTTSKEPVTRFDVPAGEHRTIPYAEYEAELRGTARGLVVGDAWESGEATPGVGEYLFVEHGRLVKKVFSHNGFREHPATLFDTATGRAVPAFELPPAYRHDEAFIVSQWVDDDGFVVWAHDYGSADTGQGDLLVCRLSTARCDLAVSPPAGTRHQIAPEAVIA